MSILDKIKENNLVGRGGACFPVATKWEMVKNAEGGKKYVVCNSAEGEPGVKKDGFILEKYPEKVIDGIKLAIDFLSQDNIDVRGIIYLNKKYYRSFGKKLLKLIGDSSIDIFDKPASAGYIGGEESSILNAIEGKRIEPRLRPPFPTTSGLYNCPTLVSNVETFLNVSLVNSGEYRNKRFYTLSGDCLWEGVYELDDNLTIENILKETGNFPDFDFFVQVGGDGSGEILNKKQLTRPASGAGSIRVYNIEKHNPKKLLFDWINFFVNESCGKCTPCREGTYRLREILESANPDWKLFSSLLGNLNETAFCGLGCVVSVPIVSYVKNVLVNMPKNKIELGGLDKKVICECFT